MVAPGDGRLSGAESAARLPANYGGQSVLPQFSIAPFIDNEPYERNSDRKRLRVNLRKAGCWNKAMHATRQKCIRYAACLYGGKIDSTCCIQRSCAAELPAA
jgi:hypothetical protein